MKIYNSYSINFTAKRSFAKTRIERSDLTKIKKIIKNTKNLQRDFYLDIQRYLDNTYAKKDYLKNFIEKFKNNSFYTKYNNVEEKYINNILTTLDLAENPQEISDEYLTRNMLKLLKDKK